MTEYGIEFAMSYLNLREAPLTFRSSLAEGQEERRYDTLNLLPYAQALRDFILDCDTPMSIGIQGDWGIGKTSLMNMLRGEEGKASGLLSSENCKVVSFDAWPYAQFNRDKNLAIACMHALTEKVGNVFSSIQDIDQSAVKSMVAAASEKLELVHKLSQDDLQGATGSENQEFADISAQMILFRQQFDALVNLWVKGGNERRLVIFIDDLDRIPPVETLLLMESIKNFIDVPGCVFVLAVDYEVVQQGMAQKLGRAIQKTSSKAWYDKMIQLAFVMPVTSYQLGTYIVGLLARADFPLCDELIEDENERQFFIDITLCTVGRNPRNIKRVMNYSNLLERIRRQQGGKSSARDAKILYALICMHIAWPELFTHFANDPTVDTVTSLENWKYLDSLEEAQPLLDRMPDKEKFKNDVSTFFDTLFALLDENGDGQIDSEELEPVVEVMMMARMTATEVRERPRDFFVRLVRENNEGGSALVDTFLENVFMKSIWYLGSECQYRRSGGRYVTIVHHGQQIGSLVSLKNNPFVFRLAMSPEQVSMGLKGYWKSKHSVKREAITLARSMFDKEASLTGFGDTVIDFSKMTNIPAKEAIGLMNALFRTATRGIED